MSTRAEMGLKTVEIGRDIPHMDVWEYDRFHIRDGRAWVTQVRVRPLEDLEEIESRYPEHVEVLSDYRPSAGKHTRVPYLKVVQGGAR